MPAPSDKSEPLSGILVLDKPLGVTSMTAVAMVRRKACGVRTGHAGTLDPLASGVLVVALGKATKFIDQLMATDKRYLTTFDLAAFTTTDDLEGDRTEVTVASPPTEGQIREALQRFTGSIMQAPPSFSAVKIAGKRAYKLARKGQAVQAPPRVVLVHSIEMMRYHWPLVELAIRCAKGFYVRSLARDLGQALGTGGHCASIRRTAVGPFTIEMAQRLDELPANLTERDVMPIDQALGLLGQVQAS
jgi:tRNA pseudouridine55 synthase